MPLCKKRIKEVINQSGWIDKELKCAIWKINQPKKATLNGEQVSSSCIPKSLSVKGETIQDK